MFDFRHARQLDRIEANQAKIIGLLQTTLQKEITMAKTIQDLTTDVTASTTLEQSIETMVTGMAAQIAALKTTQTDPATAAAIDALATQVEANNAALQAAVTANTPVPPSS